MSKTFDVIIVGGGPAGYVCAIRCGQLGLKTAVIEKEKLGGVCVNVGCIPTKALLHGAHIANLVKKSSKYGVIVGEVQLDFGVAIKNSRQISEQNSKGVGFLMKKNKVTVVTGIGHIKTGKKVVVGGETYTATRAIVVATGSSVKGIPAIGLEINKTTVISSDEALFLTEAPATLAVVGGGAVGTEFADIFNAFGSAVTLIEALPRILPLEDSECSSTVARSFKKRKIDVLQGATVKKADVGETSVTLEIEINGKMKTVVADKVLMAAGRKTNTENLSAAGIEIDQRGFVKVDANLQTTSPGVYCIGDVAGPPMLAHKGSREGVFVAEVIAGKTPHTIKYDNIPSVTYCSPEVASIGLSEDACKEQGIDYKVGKFALSANGRARATDETEGFVKIIRDPKYGEILGAHIVAAHASEMIHELTVARENEYTVEEIELAVHAHPTLSEAIAEAALDSLDRVLHT